MSGTKAGGVKAAHTNKLIYGNDFYKNIGKKGGSKTGIKKGFALDPILARAAGAKGGKISKRGKAKKNETQEQKDGGDKRSNS